MSRITEIRKSVTESKDAELRPRISLKDEHGKTLKIPKEFHKQLRLLRVLLQIKDSRQTALCCCHTRM